MHSYNRIGLICALSQELAHLQSALTEARRQQIAQWQFDVGRIQDREVALVNAGMGKVNGALVTSLLIDRLGCEAVIMSGVAGGLDPQLNIGDVIIAKRVLQHDAGVLEDGHLHTYQPGHVPFINPTEQLGYSVRSALLARVEDRLGSYRLPDIPLAAGGRNQPPRISYGTILTGDQFIRSESARVRLHRELGGHAIEMEGGAIAQTCEAFDVPWLIIRSLSDLAGRDSGIDFLAFSEVVAANSANIIRRLMPVL